MKLIFTSTKHKMKYNEMYTTRFYTPNISKVLEMYRFQGEIRDNVLEESCTSKQRDSTRFFITEFFLRSCRNFREMIVTPCVSKY